MLVMMLMLLMLPTKKMVPAGKTMVLNAIYIQHLQHHQHQIGQGVIYHPLDQYGIRSTCHLCPTSPLSPLASLASESYVTDLFWSMRPLPGQECE